MPTWRRGEKIENNIQADGTSSHVIVSQLILLAFSLWVWVKRDFKLWYFGFLKTHRKSLIFLSVGETVGPISSQNWGTRQSLETIPAGESNWSPPEKQGLVMQTTSANWELLLAMAFSRALRIWVIDCEPPHLQPPRVTKVMGSQAVLGKNRHKGWPMKVSWFTEKSHIPSGLVPEKKNPN